MHTRTMPLAGIPLLLLLLLLVLLPGPCAAFLAPEHFLKRTFTLFSGRDTACPRTISYGAARPDLTLPAASISAGGARCTGPGGKVLRSGEFVRASGLKLPTLLTGKHTRFFAGVESATRVCGDWAFNASTISYFVASSRTFRDPASGVYIEPKHLYATYSHFAHLCVFRARLSPAEQAEIAKRAFAVHATHPGKDHGPHLARHCFPAAAVVRTPSGPRRVDALRVGDRVLARPGVYSTVYAFSHRDARAVADFVRVSADSGAVITLTPGHLLYVNGELAAAADVRVGDVLTLASGARARVSRVRTVRETGLFAPHTLLGDVMVDGVAASSFTAAIRPSAAHALLSPLRVGAPLLARCAPLLAIAERFMDALRALPALPAVLTGSS